MTRRELLMTSTAVLPPERTEPEGWYGAVDHGDGCWGFDALPGTYSDGDMLEFRYNHAGDGKVSGVNWRVAPSS